MATRRQESVVTFIPLNMLALIVLLTAYVRLYTCLQPTRSATVDLTQPSPYPTAPPQRRIKRGEQAVLVIDGVTQSAFGPEVCGFRAWEVGDLNALSSTSLFYDYNYPWASCSSSSTCRNAFGTALCCAAASTCDLLTGSCVDITTSSDFTSFSADGTLYCNYYSGLACIGRTSFACGWDTSSALIVAPSKFLSDLAGTTLYYTTAYDTGVSGTLASTLFIQSIFPYPTEATSAAEPTHYEDYECAAEASKKGRGGSAPSCFVDVDSVCPYSDAEGVDIGMIDRDVWCSNIATAVCNGDVCRSGSQPLELLRYVMITCNGTGPCPTSDSDNNHFDLVWSDYANYSEAAYASLFPWSWKLIFDKNTISRENGFYAAPECPSVAEKIAAFAVVNIVVGICSLLLGRRDVVKRITFGACGKKGSKMWPLTVVLTVGLNMLANYVNALLTQRMPGFNHVPVLQLTLLWASRPRMAWLGALAISFQKEDSIYFNMAVSSTISELIQQGIGSIYLGMTVGHAVKHNYYIKGNLDYAPSGKDALQMYAGAMLWLCSCAVFLIMFFQRRLAVRRFFTHIWRHLTGHKARSSTMAIHNINESQERLDAKGKRVTIELSEMDMSAVDREDREPPAIQGEPATKHDREELTWQTSLSRMGFDEGLVNDIPFIVMAMVLPWLGQWLFWTGFLKMASAQYCPPQQWGNVAIWSIFSVTGIFLGASL